MCNFGSGYHEEQFCEIFFEFGSVVLEEIFLIWSSGKHFVQPSRTICAIVVVGIMRNNSVKLFEFGPVVQEEMSFNIFLSGALAALLFSGAEPFMQF